MKRFLPLAALLLLALLLAACGSSNSVTTNDSAATSTPAGVTTTGLVDYQNPASGISLQYPAGWSVLEESGSALTLSSDASIATGVIPSEPYGMILVNITGRGMAGLSENPNSSELVSFLTSRFNSFGLPEGSITSPPTAITINGQPAATGSVIVDDGTANEVTNIFTIFINNDRLVTTISLAPTAAIELQLRGLAGWPVAEAEIGGELVKLHEVSRHPGASPSNDAGEIIESPRGRLVIACGSGAIEVLRLQRAGGKAMFAADFLNARQDLRR